MTKFVIDTSVYFTYAFYGKLYKLFDVIEKRNLEVYIDNFLIAELERNFSKKIKIDAPTINALMSQLKEITIFHNTTLHFSNCPDPKDNFLFDLALQTNSEVIVTQEKALLNWSDSPVIIHDLKWFKENYAVD
jgi:uncharacterized protein